MWMNGDVKWIVSDLPKGFKVFYDRCVNDPFCQNDRTFFAIQMSNFSDLRFYESLVRWTKLRTEIDRLLKMEMSFWES